MCGGGVEMDCKAVLLEDFQHAFCDICVLARKKLLSALNDRYLCAQAAEELPKLKAYIASSNNNKMARDLAQLLNRSRIQNLRLINGLNSGDLRRSRPLPRIDKDQIPCNLHLLPIQFLNPQRLLPRKTRFPHNNLH